MKDKEKWEAYLRDRMKGYSEPLPDGLWERLETEMSPPRVIPMWRTRRFAVAAAALAVAVSFLTFWLVSQMPDDSYYSVPLVAEKNHIPFMPDEKPQPSVAELPLVKKMPEKVLLASVTEYPEQQGQPAMLRMGVVAESRDMEEEKTNVEDVQDRSEEEAVLYQSRRMEDRKRMQRNRAMLAERQERKSRSWSVGVNTGNTPFSSSNSFNGVGSLGLQHSRVTMADVVLAPNDGNYSAYNQMLLNNRDQISKTEVHHKMPVTVGASFTWNFAPRWALETGVNYTMLSSDLRSGADAYLEEEQELHYIGIPLKLHRSLFDSRWVSFYASAGGMVEKCVSASQDVVYVNGMAMQETEHHSLNIDALQWSVVASAGVQVNFTKQIGLYAEPGIVYYFDDNSGVETIRKEHPLNFNLQVGLRFSFGR
ncbi:MAG TPA: PorT family protein [Candidatus Phocaeicola merdavium]|nr:PorT family protein [Candidatus Phocaeicola merdavium]